MVENEHVGIIPGTIYICYQGVGKSSTVNAFENFIDLESSNFRLENGFRPNDWYKYYAQIAFDLATQGYSVFTSSHDVVRKELARLRDKYYDEIFIATVYPKAELKDAWIERLQKRYDENPTRKNKAALENAKDRFVENVAEMKADAEKFGFEKIEINSTDYFLIDELSMNDINVHIALDSDAEEY